MRKLSKREITILIVLVLLLVVFMIWLLLIKPMVEGGADIDDRLRVTEMRLNKAQKTLSLEGSVQQRYKNAVDTIGLAGSEGAEMSAMVAKIESVAREANIHIANMQPQHAVTQKGARFFPVELQIDGQWANIVHFLYLAQQQPNYYFINEMNLEKYSDATGSLRGRIVLSRMRLATP